MENHQAENHSETKYVLSNPILMEQIRQFKSNSDKERALELENSIDFGYVQSNPDLILQIQLLIEIHKQNHHAINRIS